MLAVIMWWKDW